MFDEKDGYLGFTFAGHHSSEFGLLVVSDGSRYHQNLYSNFSDTIVQVPGKNGAYYFGTQMGTKDFTIQCVFDNMNSHTRQRLEQWLYPNKTGWIIFDETPYKKYYVKISQGISFDFIPFDEFKNKGNLYFQRDIYKGELTIPFFTFYEYGIGNEDYELPFLTTENDKIIRHHAIDSGLLPINYNCEDIITTNNNFLEEISISTGFSVYNAGNGIANANFYFTIKGNSITENSPLIISNNDDGNDYIITDPSNIIKKYINSDIDSNCNYRIKILGDKQEVWLTYISGTTESEEINIGACYNHYFPKIYHKKPSDIMIINQSLSHGVDSTEQVSDYSTWSGEPLFYAYSWDDEKNFLSSDAKNNVESSFEEFKLEWSDYTIVAKNKTFSINNVINPATLFFSMPTEGNNSIPENSLVFLIYPNKFISNKTLTNFTAQFKNTYI